MSFKKIQGFFLFFISITVFITCDIDGSNSTHGFKTYALIPNTIDTLGLVATNFFKWEDTAIVQVKIYPNSIYVQFFPSELSGSRTSATIYLSDDNNKIVKILVGYVETSRVNADTNYFIEKPVEQKIFNGTYKGVFENGWLTEEIIFQDGVFSKTKNGTNDIKGLYKATEKTLVFTKNELWDGTNWITMPSENIFKEYVLNEDKIIFNSEESIYDKIE